MQAPAETYHAKGFLRTLGLVLLLFFGFNLLLSAVFPILTPRTTVGITNTKWQMIEEMKGFSGGILLGDSTAFMCIDSDILTRETGMPWFNMATYGDFGVFDDAVMLSRMIELGYDIRGIVVSHSYDALHRELSGRALADIPWYLRLPWQTLPATVAGDARWESLIRDLFPVYYRQGSLSRLLEPDSLRLVSWRNQIRTGFLDPKNETPNLEHDIPSHLKQLRSEPGREISRENRQSIVSLIKIAAAHDIPVLFISGPILDSVWRTPEYQRTIGVINTFIDTAASGDSSITSGFLDQAILPPKNMNRVDHVNSAAVGLFTEHVAKQWNRFEKGIGDLGGN